ncbi:nicotinate-nucleotide adenylyltransferase [Rosenbergiella australiborealis]|uniref:Probable nicotinate-nucleotide adenylyltransferase n=1 Tax=Rosenbergiella australiborealis TaxID=1544696 RepID=A0ABS5T7X1_9GAMM|nr:nicotinate-nucleotide adenylyltransferase [Rosenbergiella australiborealis]MBT0728437.1 nicotinate-nucleotide adenylyltransferase [Rosenbergiella australiborealis]
MSKLRAWFGGTFDPIHNGHLNCARELATLLDIDNVTLLPNNVPPHRPQPEASARQRVELLKLAIHDDPLFSIDTRELERDTPSWTIDTLTLLRAEVGETTPLAFIIGQDSLLSINRWERWQEILDYCHLIVAQRPGYASQHSDSKVQAWITRHNANVPQLQQQPCGGIFLADTGLYTISATDIRRRLHHGLSCQNLLPDSVIDYIATTGLYRHR